MTELTECDRRFSGNKDTMTCTMLDLSKAVDVVDHGILIKKCRVYGLRGNTEKLISIEISVSISSSREHGIEFKTCRLRISKPVA